MNNVCSNNVVSKYTSRRYVRRIKELKRERGLSKDNIFTNIMELEKVKCYIPIADCWLNKYTSKFSAIHLNFKIYVVFREFDTLQ